MDQRKSQIPSFDTMFQPILDALDYLGGTAKLEDLDREAVKRMEIPEALCGVPHTDKGSDHRTEVGYRLAWARTYLKKYGLIENPERGVWMLTSLYFTTEIIDSKLIVRTVRQKNLEEFKESEAKLSNYESASAFGRFALAALRDHVEAEGKTIRVEVKEGGILFDAILPKGIQGDDRRTYVEIANVPMLSDPGFWEQLSVFATHIKSAECLMVVLADVLPEAEKWAWESKIQGALPCGVWIWDYNDLTERAAHEPDYIGYLVDPQRELVKDAIVNAPSSKQQREIKKERIECLKKEYDNQDLMLFLGAGVSIAAGLPLWSTLIHRMLVAMIDTWSEGKKLTPKELELLSKLAEENEESTPLTQVRYISSGFKAGEYQDLVRSVLYEKPVDISTDLLTAICKISKPEYMRRGVKGIVTYNFDDLLERRLREKEIKYHVVYREQDRPDISALNLYHVHGYLPWGDGEAIDPEMTLIFSEEDYHKVYRDAYCWSNLTQLNAFRDSTCLFIGCSLTDPNLRRLLDVYKRSNGEPRHYAILPRQKPQETKTGKRTEQRLLNLYQRIDDNIRETYFKSIGIKVIWVDDYDEIPGILNGFLPT